MIRSLAVLLAGLPAAALADEPPPEPAGEETDVLSRHRTPFDVLAERAIGTASVPVEFNWRRSDVMVAGFGNHYYELNNFNSLRAGGMVRFPTDQLIFELGVGYVFVWDTPSSELLALTPYRQPGRPRRIEIDATVGYPLAEGVVTAVPRFFPAVQMVFSAYGSFRYLVYPMSFEGLRVREVGAAIASGSITDDERDNLEDRRLEAMQIDSARYGTMLGVGTELYFRQGLFVMPRVMFAVPLLAPATGTELYWWADLSLSVGVAF